MPPLQPIADLVPGARRSRPPSHRLGMALLLVPFPWTACTWTPLGAATASAAEPPDFAVVVTNCLPSAVSTPVPVCLEVDRQTPGFASDDPAHGPWLLTEFRAGRESGPPIAAQIEPNPSPSSRSRLWWLMPPSDAPHRRFQLAPSRAVPQSSESSTSSLVSVQSDPQRLRYTVLDAGRPVLTYNHGTVPVPEGVGTNYARGDYIMPLYGPSGELLTDDYPKDHPHHRGLGWSWPVTRWGKEVRDIWAVAGVWARPVALRRTASGPVFALIEAESVWKWGDTHPIVREELSLRVFRQEQGGRCIDVELRLTTLEDGVAIGGRPGGGYGGFGLRAQPARNRQITRHVDAPGASPRRSWLDYSGLFAGAARPAGLTILEHAANPLYPSELKEYPELNYVMPAFPGDRELPLSRSQPLVLRHRLWIHSGLGQSGVLAQVWAGYASPPQAALQTFQAQPSP